MQLSREGIQRMIGNLGSISTAAGGGGEGGSSSQWVNDNFVAIPYWNQLFTIYGKQTVTVTDGTTGDVTVTETDMTLPPNTLPSTVTTTDPETGDVTETKVEITRIEALFDFDSVGGVSALGYSPGGGGGGGADLKALLASINDSSIGSTAPTASQLNKCLVWTSNGWDWGTTGGGGGTGTVTSVTAGTGLVTNPSGGITTTGSISIASSYLTHIDEGHQAYGWGNHANAGYLTQSSLSGYATQTWVANQGYATQTWVTGKGYITSAALSGYATESWVNQQGFLKLNDLASYLKVGSDGVVEGGQYYDFHMQSTTSDFSTRLQVTADNRNTLTLPSASGTLATQEWVNSQGYMLRTEGMRFTDYGNYIAARFVLADGTYDATRSGKAQGSGFIEWWSTGGYFNHRMGSVSIYDGVNDDTCYLQIGGGRIYWDPSSKSLYVVQSDGSTPANIYATGGVSALGISTGGTPSVSELAVNTLKGVRYLQNATGAVSITSGNSYIYIGAGSGSNVYIADSNNTYFDTNGHLHLKGKYLYLDDTRYVYVSNGHLYFNNGSSNIQIA